MRKIISLILLIASAFTAMAQVNDYCLKIGDFKEMTIANGIKVIYRCNPDSAGYAVYSCPKDIASAITFSNDRDKLKVQVISDSTIHNLPILKLYSLALTQVTNWGDSTIYVDQINPGPSFKANVIGNGNIVVRNIRATSVDASVKAGSGHVYMTGICQTAKYTIMSAGAIEAANLQAAQVKCHMFGTGCIDCWATEKLNVDGMGSGKIFYKGSPAIKKHVAGVKVIPMESE